MSFYWFFLFLALAATLFSRVEQFEHCFSKEHFCEIISKLALEEMSFYDFSIFSSGGHFVQRSRTILAIFDKLHQGIVRMKLF